MAHAADHPDASRLGAVAGGPGEAPHGHPRNYPSDIPATGAWLPGHPVGDRRFHRFAVDRPFALEGGGRLVEAEIAYETWGTLADDASNAVLVCHALTGDSHVHGPSGHGHPSEGWWNEFVGPGRALDTDRWFVVCANVLGGCQGSTGPASPHPVSGVPYGSSFPTVTIRDMVRTQASLADQLGIRRWHSVVGGSMGGMQVLEWAVMYPDRVRSIMSFASTTAATAQQIAWSAVGRTALALDPRWRGGDYYDAPPGQGPHAGLAVARSVAQITYRSEPVFDERFDRDLVDPHAVFGLWDRFEVEGYLDHHGQKLARRFDANSYLVLNRAMDLHDIGRGRGGVPAALARVRCPTLVVSISSDTLYPPHLQRALADGLGALAEWHQIESPQGHDGFLLETEALGELVEAFLERLDTDPDPSVPRRGRRIPSGSSRP
jgi:homoserine O-acetyltransferase